MRIFKNLCLLLAGVAIGVIGGNATNVYSLGVDLVMPERLHIVVDENYYVLPTKKMVASQVRRCGDYTGENKREECVTAVTRLKQTWDAAARSELVVEHNYKNVLSSSAETAYHRGKTRTLKNAALAQQLELREKYPLLFQEPSKEGLEEKFQNKI